MKQERNMCEFILYFYFSPLKKVLYEKKKKFVKFVSHKKSQGKKYKIYARFIQTLTWKINFMVSFYGWDSTASRLEPLQGGSLLFTTKFSEIPGTHFIDLGRMKDWVDLGPPSSFEHGNPGLGIQHLNHEVIAPWTA